MGVILDNRSSQNWRNGIWLFTPGYVHGITDVEWNDWGDELKQVFPVKVGNDNAFDSAMRLFTSQRQFGEGVRGVDDFALLMRPAGPGGGASKADVDAAADRVISKIPTKATLS